MFRELSRHYDLQVIFDEPREQNREWNVPEDLGFPHVYSEGITVPYLRRRTDFHAYDTRYLQLRNGLPSLSRFCPELIVSCELGPRSLQALTYSRLKKIPLILWSEGTPHTEGWVSEWKRRIRRYLVTHASRFWTNGQESAHLLGTYGALPEQIDCGLIGVDTHRLLSTLEESRNARDSLRQRLGLRGKALLFVGQFIQRKGVHEYLRALELLRGTTREEFSVLLVGAGPLQGLLENWASTHPAICMRLVPFQQPDRLPPYYAASDLFVLPTLEDNWSLVTLEAALAGLPQIFSRFNGAGVDLMRMGAPGESVDPADTDQFVASLRRFVDHTSPRAPSYVVEGLASVFSPEECTARARRSIESCLQLPVAA
jgi:glycosyltransferase involved in cell wall biosynthesis